MATTPFALCRYYSFACLVLPERLEIYTTNAIPAHLCYVSTRRRILISSVVPNYSMEVLFSRPRPHRVLRRARLRTTKHRYVFVLRIGGCSSEHTPPCFSFSQAAVVAAAAFVLRRDDYARGTYFAHSDDGGGIGVWRATQSSSCLWKTNESSLDGDDRQPWTALLGPFEEGTPFVIDAAATDTHM